MTASDRIFALIKQRKTTAAEVSKQTGISQGNFTDWKKGRSRPGHAAIVKIAAHFGVSVDYLSGSGEDPRPKDQHGFDELEYAMLDGFRELTDEQKRIMIEMAKQLSK